MEKEVIYEIDGNMGKTLTIYEDKYMISISNKGKAVLWGQGALNGTKTVYFKDVSSVQFKNVGMTTGYLTFEYAGSRSISNFNGENSFPFSATIGTAKHKKLKELMTTVYEYVKEKIEYYKNANDIRGNYSAADEIKKFKELLDEGIISQEEFDRKKAELLK